MPADSGTEKSPTIWTAQPSEQPWISGGRRLANWTRSQLGGREVWTAKLPADCPAIVRQLWLGDKRLERCRLPKRGTLVIAGFNDAEKAKDAAAGTSQFRYALNDLHAWPTATDGEAIVTNRWVESHLPITAIDEKNHLAHFGKPAVFGFDPDDRYWIENVRELLTEPGEFYIDPRQRVVYLLPPAGIDPNRAEIVAPRLPRLVQLEGDVAAGKLVEHLVFRGIGFAHTAWDFSSPAVGVQGSTGKGTEWSSTADPKRSGFNQAAVGVPGAIGGVGVRDCAFESCRVEHVGTYGLELGGGCQKNRITHCVFNDLAARRNQARRGGPFARRLGRANFRHRNLPIARSPMEEISFQVASGLWIGEAYDNVVSHNEIHGLWYTGISIGWTWGYGASSAQRNLVEYNDVHHIGMKADGDAPILSDMGGIYTLGNQEGSRIRNNRFHDIAGLHYGGWGIYFDEGTTHQVAVNNLVYRTTHGSFHRHYGQENVVRNNILAFGRDAQIQAAPGWRAIRVLPSKIIS